MLNEKELSDKLGQCPAARVTADAIKARIAETEFSRFSNTVTICSLKMDNGYSVRGESACVNPENYNQEIGEKIAYDNAFSKLWPLFGFMLAEKQWQSRPADATKAA